jgi:hypothetical protein
MNPIFEQISQVVKEFSIELDNALMLIEGDRLHHAMNRVNEPALMAIRVAEDMHVAVVDGHTLEPNPIPARTAVHADQSRGSSPSRVGFASDRARRIAAAEKGY